MVNIYGFYLILEQIHQVDPDQRRPSRPNGLFLRLYRPFLEIMNFMNHLYESFIVCGSYRIIEQEKRQNN